MKLKCLEERFSICKLSEPHVEDLMGKMVFLAKTDEEVSLVCPTERVPEWAMTREDGWRALRIEGVLDFSLIGILAPIAKLFADAKIGIFVVSTYNTDYVFVREVQLAQAKEVLAGAGYTIA